MSVCSPHYVDPTGQTVLVKETGLSPQDRCMGLGDQCEGCEGKAGREGGEEDGVCLNTQPLWVDGQ